MNIKAVSVVAGAIALLAVSNYSTFWATDKINEVGKLQEQLDKYEKLSGQQAALLTDGPKGQ